MTDRKKTSLSFSASLAKKVKQRGIDFDLDFSSAIEQACIEWVAGPAAASPAHAPPGEAAERPLFRKENQRWHAILEQVLNDPDEALGIMKNLEWAERTVLEKRKRPAGRLANGE